MIRRIPETQVIKMFKVRNEISQLNDAKVFLKKYIDVPLNANSTYVKYTSKNSMYKMLESDSLFMFCSELSNDKTENKMLDIAKREDTYISCFYNYNYDLPNALDNSSDILSQWMSYCYSGGAAFEFYFGQDFFARINPKNTNSKHDEEVDNFFRKIATEEKNRFCYSLMTNDAVDDSDFVLYPNFPFQLQYYENTINDSDSVALAFETIKTKYNIDDCYILPYLKHSGFVQESEARLAFVNVDDCLSDCIKFIEVNDGTRIPYIDVRFGNNDLSKLPCDFVEIEGDETLEQAIEKKLKERNKFINNPKFPIIIPQGRNQEQIYNLVEKTIKKLFSDSVMPKIICQGHLPITKITLAPTQDRTEQRKKMEIFCKSKYWLRNVEIVESQIPYNTNNSNHT